MRKLLSWLIQTPWVILLSRRQKRTTRGGLPAILVEAIQRAQTVDTEAAAFKKPIGSNLNIVHEPMQVDAARGHPITPLPLLQHKSHTRLHLSNECRPNWPSFELRFSKWRSTKRERSKTPGQPVVGRRRVSATVKTKTTVPPPVQPLPQPATRTLVGQSMWTCEIQPGRLTAKVG